MYFNLRLFGMTKGLRLRILVAAVAGLLTVAASIARLALTGIVLAKVFQGDSFSTLVLPLGILVVLILVRGALQHFRDNVSYRTAAETKVALRQRLYQHALALGPGHFDQLRTGEVTTFLVDGVENLETFFGQYLPQFIVAAVAPLLIFGFIAFLDVRIGLVFVVFALFTLLAPSFIQKANRPRTIARRDAWGAMGADMLDSIQGLGTLKAFGQSKARGELLAKRARDVFRTTMWMLAADGASGAATVLGISAGAAVALVWGGVKVSNGELELSALLIILMLGAEVFRPMRELAQLYHLGMTAMSSAEGVFALLDTPVEIKSPATPSGAPGGRLEPQITFEGVTFGYEKGRREALHDVSFTLRKGERLGVVGPSGAGKSTLVWLMLRLYDPQQGRVLLGGHDLRELPLDVLREQVSVVTQDTYLFQGTVAENLRLGRPDASREDLEKAAVAANAHEFITALPNGYDSEIGERGVRLSGGERQRIAIARALLKSAPILLLDEALSNVDAENESVIQEALDRLMEGRTTLVIAHRLSSVVGADRIIVLDQGRVVESGSHAELAASGGIYSRLMADQQVGETPDLIAAAAMDDPRASDADERGQPSGDSPAWQPVRSVGRWENWTRLTALVRRWWVQVAVTLALGLLYHGSTIALGAVSALLVAAVFNEEPFWFLVALLAVLTPLSAMTRWGESWISHHVAFKLLAEMRIEMYRRLEPLAPAYLVKRRSGDLVSIAGDDIEKIEYFFAHTITPAMIAVLAPGAVLAVLAFLAWPLALVLLPFLAVGALSPFIAQVRTERVAMEMRRHLGRLNAYLVDGIQGMREIVAFGAGRRRLQETTRRGRDLADHRMRFLRSQSAHSATIEVLTALAGLSVLSLGAWLVGQGQMEPTDLPLATLLALSSFSPVTELAVTLKQLIETLASSRRVFEVYDEPVAVHDGPGLGPDASREDGGAPSIDFQDVGFAYDPDLRRALDNVSFETGSGATVALVGRSGAGKSTTANLIMRFWDPDEGRVTLDDDDLKQFELDELRSRIALVTQDTYLFNTSIMENLRIARPDATDTEIRRAARLASAEEFIDALPDGYDTLAGERGMQLSGGQRQRISIARAVLKDAPVLILDEATSHLDAVNEKQIRDALRHLMSGRTTVVIAHRLSTVRDADRIVVMSSGKVVEQGTHDDLLRKKGLYAQLVSTQLVGAAGPRRG